MINLQSVKHVAGLAPISLNSAAATPLTCDCFGFSYALAIVTFGVIGGAATVFRIEESATDFSGAAITAYTGVGSTGNLRLPQTADAGKIFVYGLPVGGNRLRYLQFAITTGATTLVSVNWVLGRANQMPDTITERGVTAQVFS